MSELLERANELVKRLRSDMDAIKDVVDKVSAFDLAFDEGGRFVQVAVFDPIETGLRVPSSLLLDSMGGKSGVKDRLIGWLTKYESVLPKKPDADYQSLWRMARWLLSRLEDRVADITYYIEFVVNGIASAKRLQELGDEPVRITVDEYHNSSVPGGVYVIPASSLVEHLAVEMTWREGQLDAAMGKWESVVMPVVTAIRQERDVEKVKREIEAAAKERA